MRGGGWGAATDGDEEGEATGRKEEDREQKEKEGKEKVREWLSVGGKVLTHSLCLLIIRSMSSFIFLYLSSDSGLWPTESSASGSGLSQPFRPFFLNVCKQSSCTTELRGFARQQRQASGTRGEDGPVGSHPSSKHSICTTVCFPASPVYS